MRRYASITHAQWQMIIDTIEAGGTKTGAGIVAGVSRGTVDKVISGRREEPPPDPDDLDENDPHGSIFYCKKCKGNGRRNKDDECIVCLAKESAKKTGSVDLDRAAIAEFLPVRTANMLEKYGDYKYMDELVSGFDRERFMGWRNVGRKMVTQIGLAIEEHLHPTPKPVVNPVLTRRSFKGCLHALRFWSRCPLILTVHNPSLTCFQRLPVWSTGWGA